MKELICPVKRIASNTSKRKVHEFPEITVRLAGKKLKYTTPPTETRKSRTRMLINHDLIGVQEYYIGEPIPRRVLAPEFRKKDDTYFCYYEPDKVTRGSQNLLKIIEASGIHVSVGARYTEDVESGLLELFEKMAKSNT